MSKPMAPELKRFLEKRMQVRQSARMARWRCTRDRAAPRRAVPQVTLNGKRTVSGVLRGFDHYANLTLGEAVEVVSATHHVDLGTIVRVAAPSPHLASACAARLSSHALTARRSFGVAVSCSWSA